MELHHLVDELDEDAVPRAAVNEGVWVYEDELILGNSLPDKTLCLTFDDGPGQTDAPEPAPGPRTLEIAQYLNKEGIRATFFMVGKFAHLTGIMQKVQELGHLIGNHTYDHVRLVDHVSKHEDVASQISRTDSLIRNWVDGPVVFFRPPYGEWDDAVARTLNADHAVSLGHVGPIGWDINCEDWQFWRDGNDPSLCAACYLDAIAVGGKGIVLMHDCTADNDRIKLANRTFDLIRELIPNLQRQGYKFVRLDEIPEIAVRAQNSSRYRPG